MCGIIGGVATLPISELLIDGLEKLEYRGYDSAGVALVDGQPTIDVTKAKGKVVQVKKKLQKKASIATCGIAHTRWATHGKPSEKNAHPHVIANRIAIVHNGIIENYQEIKRTIAHKYQQTKYVSQTDTEVIAWYIYYALLKKNDIVQIIRRIKGDFEGSYALAILDCQQPDQIIAIRKGSPIVVGTGLMGNFVASDPIAMVNKVESIGVLDEDDTALINGKEIQIYGKKSRKNIVYKSVAEEQISTEKGDHRHYMEKEIHEQPEKIQKTLDLYSDTKRISFHNANLEKKLKQTRGIHCIACGTSYHAACIARYWLEGLAGVSSQVEVASEYRYRKNTVMHDTLFIALSQSGETADTLAALRKAKKSGEYLATVAICNSPLSSLVREAQYSLITNAGREISVASTKAFTTQLVILFLLALSLSQKNKTLKAQELRHLLKEIHVLPKILEKVIQRANEIEAFSQQLANKQHAIYIGRGTMFPLAQEGALKLKEISYLYAEAYPAGELKHGPLALIDEETPIIVVSPPTTLLKKLQSNLEEIKTRGGKMLIFLDENQQIKKRATDSVVRIPHVDSELAPLVYIVPLQLLAYQVAIHKGTDLDQPRNLAKAVTVE